MTGVMKKQWTRHWIKAVTDRRNPCLGEVQTPVAENASCGECYEAKKRENREDE